MASASRILVERSVRICSACGEDEAVRDYSGQAPVPPREWPVAGPLLNWSSLAPLA
ncbi:hypothetical protein ACWDR0_31560 [Streptomyces sp. NPDC003691]